MKMFGRVVIMLKKFVTMYCTAGTLLFLGLNRCDLDPKLMIWITGAACGLVNMLFYWLDGE